jgi:DNA modification methylase
MLLKGDCLELLRGLPDCSVDSVVTDPPYELGFMGKRWDASGVAYNVELWGECLRVLKPGGHLLAFGGTRTYHRMVVAIEDAGFEIRDSIHWIYGSGFPKSLDVSKAIDKSDAVVEQQARRYRFTEWVRSTGLTARQIDEATGTNMGGHYTTSASQPAIMTVEHLDAVRHLIGVVPEWVEAECRKRSVESKNFAEREVVGPTVRGAQQETTGRYGAWGEGITPTAPATPEAERWSGWGTALKPAHEPVVVARKPLCGTVAGNVLGWGVGGLNIDACRVAGVLEGDPSRFAKTDGGSFNAFVEPPVVRAEGRWPANVVHDGSPEVCDRFPNSTSGKGTITITKREGTWDRKDKGMFDAGRSSTFEQYGDSGSASRFFAGLGWADVDEGSFLYCAKAGRRERNAGDTDNRHPTVKPIALMRWLVRLVTQPDGTVLDPFLGSGTTAVAATLEGVKWVGCEMTEDYWPIIEGRVLWAEGQRGLL